MIVFEWVEKVKLMYWTVKARRTRENNDNELIHLGNLFKQIGKHLTTIQITGRITRNITGLITGPITGFMVGILGAGSSAIKYSVLGD